MQKKANPAALLPILEFLLLYLGLGLIFEYVLKIPMGFYSIPIVVIFLVAVLAARHQQRDNKNRRIFSAAPKTNLPPPTRILLRPWTISFTATFIPVVS